MEKLTFKIRTGVRLSEPVDALCDHLVHCECGYTAVAPNQDVADSIGAYHGYNEHPGAYFISA